MSGVCRWCNERLPFHVGSSLFCPVAIPDSWFPDGSYPATVLTREAVAHANACIICNGDCGAAQRVVDDPSVLVAHEVLGSRTP
jgi:hypothetical protein